MAETAKGTPKGMEGVDAIMKSEPGAMMSAVKTVNQVAPEAPYELIANEKSPTPVAEAYAKDLVETRHDGKEEIIPEDQLAEDHVFTEKDIIEHNEKGLELEKFFQKELVKAQKSVAKLSAKGPMKMIKSGPKSTKKSGGGDKNASEDESYT